MVQHSLTLMLAGRASEKFPVVVTSHEIVIANSKVLQPSLYLFIVNGATSHDTGCLQGVPQKSSLWWSHPTRLS